MSPRHLVLGATGQVGSHLVQALRQQGEDVVGTGHTREADLALDLADIAQVTALLNAQRPDTIWVVGAYTHVDGCEEHPEASAAINRDAPVAAAEWARTHGASLRFFSTDYVFDGKDGPYDEEDTPHPLQQYGLHKLQAEQAILSLAPERSLVLRTAWVYSWESVPKNFMQRLVLNLRQGHAATIPEDQWGNPTYAPDLARAAMALDRLGAAGLFHVAGPTSMTRYAFARRIAEIFRLEASLVHPVPSSTLRQPAQRPLKAGMRVEKLKALTPVPHPIDEILPRLARDYPA